MSDAAKRLAVMGFCDAWSVEVVEALTHQHDWSIAFWHVADHHRRAIEERFPDTVVHTVFEGKRLAAPVGVDGNRWPLYAPEVVQLMAPYEPVLWPAFLRKAVAGRSPGSMSTKDEYHRILTYRYCLFREMKPEVMLISNTPTGFHSFLFYILAKHFGATIYMLRRTGIPVRPLSYFVTELEEGSLRIRDRFEEIVSSGEYKTIELSPAMDAYISGLRQSYDKAMPDYFKQKFKVDKKTGNLTPRRTLLREYYDLLRDPKRSSSLRRFANNLVRIHRRRKLLDFYQNLVSEVDFETPYVLACLHYQPEGSTIPSGGMYAYQILMVDMIARMMPEGWTLYVKEQPSQLLYGYLHPRYREPTSYLDLLRYPCVRLVSVFEQNFRLIDRARAVATVTGTTSWEAANRGVPGLFFGAAWYRYCEGTFYVPDEQSLRAAFDKIVAGYRPDVEKVRAFAGVLEQECVTGAFRNRELEAAAGGAQAYGREMTPVIRHALDMAMASQRLAQLRPTRGESSPKPSLP